MRRLIVKLLRTTRPARSESLATLNARLARHERADILRGILAQGETARNRPQNVAPEVVRYVEDEEFYKITKREPIEICPTLEMKEYFTDRLALPHAWQVAVITPTRSFSNA